MSPMPAFLGFRMTAALVMFALAMARAEGARPKPPDDLKFVETRVQPLLAERCIKCHGATNQKGGLRLDSADAIRKGGASGRPLITSGTQDAGLLLRAVRHDDGVKPMPPGDKLGDAEIAALETWVSRGAPFPAATHWANPDSTKHWAFLPVRAPAAPPVKDESWPKSPMDRFVLAKLEASHLQPAPQADRRTLIRRTTFDLTGLPPTPDEVEDFVRDGAPDAFERVVDRLLASPAYGERWGRHWLDVARYADSNGYEFDEVRPDAWRYRDYVVRSFNADLPYTRFIGEQLAGDELAPDDPWALVATGFNLLGPDMTDSSDQMQRRHNTLNDMTDTVGLTFLGLTIGCARCHDHKFEPLTQTDYYRLQALFTPAKFLTNLDITPKERRASLAAAVNAYQAKRKPVQAALDELEGPVRSRLRKAKLDKQSEEVRDAHETPEAKRTPAQRERVAETIRFVGVSQAEILKKLDLDQRRRHQELAAALKRIDAAKPNVAVAMGLEDGAAEKTFVLERGEPAHRGEEVQPGFPKALSNELPRIKPLRPTTTGRRAALATWLADERHPLTARVMVNRLWTHHFGRGIVRTPSDFGVRGDLPSHPELLDWLAAEFMRSGWSLKRMHRLIVTSATYRQSTLAPPASLKADPENRLLSRMNRKRLEGEAVRDGLLAISGRLDRAMGGPGTTKRATRRRSIYLFARRNLRDPFLEAFDLPDSNLSCPKRECSTTTPQALALLNDDEVADAAKLLGRKLSSEQDLVAAAYRLTLGRAPSATETEAASAFLKESPLSELCRALFNLNEFVYLD
jgi:mono/diheme cytochrome c family protein